MSSLLNPALFNDNDYITNNDTNNGDSIIYKRKQNNKTLKNFSNQFSNTDQTINPEKVKKAMDSIDNIHLSSCNDDDIDSNLGDYFNPPEKPISSAMMKKPDVKEGMTNLGIPPQPAQEYKRENLALNNLQTNYGNNKMTHDYYKQFIPNFTNLPDESSTKLSYQNYPTISNNIEQTIPSSSQNNSFQGHNRDVLVEKLNYMIHL